MWRKLILYPIQHLIQLKCYLMEKLFQDSSFCVSSYLYRIGSDADWMYWTNAFLLYEDIHTTMCEEGEENRRCQATYPFEWRWCQYKHNLYSQLKICLRGVKTSFGSILLWLTLHLNISNMIDGSLRKSS